jgi:cytochrome c oxidase subunit 4
MAITPDSGVRSNAAIDLAQLSEEDRALIDRRQTAAGAIPGMQGVDVPVNAPPHGEPHVAPAWIMYATFAALILLTVLTVFARQFDLGAMNIWIALVLAGVKSFLVALFFMHLWWDSKFNQLIIGVSLLFLVIFIGAAITDTDQYQPQVQPPSAYTAPLENPPS